MKPHSAILAEILADAVNQTTSVQNLNMSSELSTLFLSVERQANHSLLGQLHEAVGLLDVMIVKARPHEALDYLLMGIWSLNFAAHSYRKAGEHELARIAGQRALWELNQFVVDGELRKDRFYEHFRIWYVLEMMGDAAVCADPPKARKFYEAARSGFAQMDDLDQAGEAAEIFPGYYLTDFAKAFLGDDDAVKWDGVRRVEVKMRHWT